jgi:hypothetical protein
MDKHKLLFGMPLYHTKIDPMSFKKNKIIKDITKNYKKDPTRNNWNKFLSNSHHGYKDWDNNNFVEPDFDDLIPIYSNKIKTFLHSLGTNQPIYTFKFNIVNYTCMSEDQYMERHHHLPADFIGTHYIKFPAEARSTFYFNQMSYSNYLSKGACDKEGLRNLYDKNDTKSSWLYSDWGELVEEDDFVIVPGLVSHGVPINKSKELRMTIVMNIHLTFNEEKITLGD